MSLKKIYGDIDELITKELSSYKEHSGTASLIAKYKDLKSKKILPKNAFMEIAKLKSHRPKNRYDKNEQSELDDVAEIIFDSSKNEKEIIKKLCELNGVRIPVASEILMITDPQNYAVIDIRVWKVLYKYELVNENEKGKNFTVKQWEKYLEEIRKLAKKYCVTARDIERTIFNHHSKNNKGNLYDAEKKQTC